MSASTTSASIDPLRKLAIVAVLVAGMMLLYQFATPSADFDPTGMLALGFVILASYAVGQLVGVVGLPHITGYLLAGLVLGPSVAHNLPEALRIPPFHDGILNADVIDQLSLLNALAFSLIALTAGGELRIEQMRTGLRNILGVVGGQLILVFPLIVGLFWLVSGPIPAIAFAPLAALSTTHALAFACIGAAAVCATSPAAAIAVINETGASGPTARTILSAVVMHDLMIVVLFSLVSAAAGTVLGTAGENLGLYLFTHIGGSVLLGIAVAGILHLYLRYVGHEILLFLLALIYATAYIAQIVEAEVVLTFITAGFIAGNYSRESDTLLHEVERLSLPVFVVFFTLAGARLHVDALALLAPFALALVTLRAVGTFVGVSTASRLVGAPANTRRYAWMGMVPQAGVALSLAAMVGQRHGEVGQSLETLIIAGVAVNEMIGPVMLKLGLGFSGEIAKAGEPEAPEQAPAVVEAQGGRLPAWQPPPEIEDPWGPPPDLSSKELRELVANVEGDLQTLVRDLAQGPLERFRLDASRYLRALRREFLRHHRRALVQAQSGGAGALPAMLRTEQAELAARWRGVVLDRGARKAQDGWSPLELVDAVDQIAEALPEVVHAPWEPGSLVSAPDESPWVAVQKGWLRVRRRVSAMGGGSPPLRDVGVRNLARYHFSGRLPQRTEAIAALSIAAEAHLSLRTRSLFDAILHGYDAAAQGADGLTPEQLAERLWSVRHEVEEEFTLAATEVDRIVHDGVIRTARVLGEALQRFKQDLHVTDTPDLPRRARRYSAVLGDRVQALELLGPGLQAARKSTSARYTVLALELELVALERRIKEAVNEHGTHLARLVRGRGATQLDRVDVALDDALKKLDDELSEPKRSGRDLASAIRSDAEPLARVVAEASRSASRLRDDLSNEEIIAPLLDALLSASQSLTEHYVVPTGPPLYGEWTLPAPVPTAEVPFRELVITYIESSVTRNLLRLTRDLTDEVRKIAGVLEELERIVAFNVELAGGELDVLQNESVPPETAELVSEMVVGALTRSRGRLHQLRDEVSGLHTQASEGVRSAVLDGLEALRAQVVDGRVAELRLRLLREATSIRNLTRDAEQLSGLLTRARERGGRVLETALGADRLALGRQRLGLQPATTDGPSPATFAAPRPPEHLPLVYRRLFSDQALEAGDLLTGRHEEINRARTALTGQPGGILRSVALVGMDGVGKGAVVNALVRSMKPRSVQKFQIDHPASVSDIDAWLDVPGEGHLFLIDDFEWLFTMRPGGAAPLARLVDAIVSDGGRNAWLLDAELPQWHAAARSAPLADAFAAVVQLSPLAPGELGAAVLARHSMSGYGLRFEAHSDLGWQVQHLLTRRADQDERRRDAWFQMLHRATGGVIRDALLLWMASIRKVDEIEGVVRVGPVRRPPIAALRVLPEDTLLTLRHVLHQGWTEPALHAASFRTSLAGSTAHLAHLAHLGLLVPRAHGRYRMPGHLKAPLQWILEDRRWT